MSPRHRPLNRITRRFRELEDTALFEPVKCSAGTPFADGMYTIGAAADMATRRAAYRLIYSLYLEKEYAAPHPSRMWLSIFDALPETTTLVVKQGDDVVAALTVIFDSEMKLPADRLYSAELDAMRRAGRRPAEIVSLGVSPSASKGSEILVKLFNFVYLLSRRIRGATDFINTVNPRHAGFYRRTLMFEKAGEVRNYDKVGGAPAVMLRLDLDVPEERIRLEHGPLESHPPKSRTLYKMFHAPQEEPQLVKAISRSLRAMTERELRCFFIEKTHTLRDAPARQRRHIEDCYPFYDLVLETTDTREYLPVQIQSLFSRTCPGVAQEERSRK
jgi:N-acyl amino acid synthase FeeM